jgi:putative acetyltransferase
MTQATPTISVVDATHPDAEELIRQLSEELGTVYGHDGSGAFSPADVAVPRAAFVIAYLNNQPVACGAIRPFSDDPTTVEVKRMFVVPSARGKGISRLILRKLESLASFFSYTSIKLETGIHQHAAIALYEKEGYGRIPCYGKYVTDPVSLCYGKLVTPLSQQDK